MKQEEVENTRNAASFSSENYELVGEEGRKRERRNYRKETRVLLCYDKYSEVLVMKNKREMENKRYQSDQSDKIWTKLTMFDVETRSEQSQAGQGKTSSAHSGTLVEDKPAKVIWSSWLRYEYTKIPIRISTEKRLEKNISKADWIESSSELDQEIRSMFRNQMGNPTKPRIA
ncbi:hypothetical protein F511_42551 [Dorcoceras hygrometricum]|uniref:Uncharacterized protein n=1 Tax=Dorcoceras hygrometricum TaxID=472368 RepID=A0A2Z7B6V7_9LAMI|nr:hypothetical protein F511_42551 [Dorcoceras hygrometricum]